MNTIDGAFFLAVSNSVFTSFSPSPTYLDVSTAAVMLNRVALASVASARTKSVFPFPGGPKSSKPREGERRPPNSSGLSRDRETNNSELAATYAGFCRGLVRKASTHVRSGYEFIMKANLRYKCLLL